MRILQLVTRRQLRGAEVFAAQLAAQLSERGHRITFAGLYPPVSPGLDVPGAQVVDLGGSPGTYLSPTLILRTARLLRDGVPEVIQANGADTLKVALFARRLGGSTAPVVYRNIGMASAWLRGALHRAWNRWLAGQADHIVAVSRTAARDYRATYAIAPERITTIPIGTRIPHRIDRDAARRRLAEILGRTPEGPILLHAGSFTPEKDHAALVEAFAEVAQAHPRAHLVLAGDGPLRPATTARVQALGLGARVALPGVRDDLPKLLAGADLFVLSSRTEGIPGVLLEAAAHSVPVVATDVGSVSDIVLEGHTGTLVAPGDPRALAAAIRSSLDDPDCARAFGAAGRECVRRHFELGKVVDRFEDLYHRLTESADV